MTHTDSNRPTFLRLGFFILILAVLCTVLSYVTAQWVINRNQQQSNHEHGQNWLRQELNLTAAEAAQMEGFDREYRAQRKELLQTFQARINELSDLLRTQDHYSSQVTDAVHRLHSVHGQLQTLSIKHYYDILSVLPPEKQEKLRSLAVEALSQPE